MEMIIKATGIAVVAAVCALSIRKHTPELSLLLSLTAVLLIFSLSGTALKSTVKLLKDISDFSGMSIEHLEPLLKVLGITIITKISSDICKDSGSASLASITELAGNVISVIVSVPLISAMLKFISSI